MAAWSRAARPVRGWRAWIALGWLARVRGILARGTLTGRAVARALAGGCWLAWGPLAGRAGVRLALVGSGLDRRAVGGTALAGCGLGRRAMVQPLAGGRWLAWGPWVGRAGVRLALVGSRLGRPALRGVGSNLARRARVRSTLTGCGSPALVGRTLTWRSVDGIALARGGAASLASWRALMGSTLARGLMARSTLARCLVAGAPLAGRAVGCLVARSVRLRSNRCLPAIRRRSRLRTSRRPSTPIQRTTRSTRGTNPRTTRRPARDTVRRTTPSTRRPTSQLPIPRGRPTRRHPTNPIPPRLHQRLPTRLQLLNRVNGHRARHPGDPRRQPVVPHRLADPRKISERGKIVMMLDDVPGPRRRHGVVPERPRPSPDVPSHRPWQEPPHRGRDRLRELPDPLPEQPANTTGRHRPPGLPDVVPRTRPAGHACQLYQGIEEPLVNGLLADLDGHPGRAGHGPSEQRHPTLGQPDDHGRQPPGDRTRQPSRQEPPTGNRHQGREQADVDAQLPKNADPRLTDLVPVVLHTLRERSHVLGEDAQVLRHLPQRQLEPHPSLVPPCLLHSSGMGLERNSRRVEAVGGSTPHHSQLPRDVLVVRWPQLVDRLVLDRRPETQGVVRLGHRHGSAPQNPKYCPVRASVSMYIRTIRVPASPSWPTRSTVCSAPSRMACTAAL